MEGICGGCLEVRELLIETMGCQECSRNHRSSRRTYPQAGSDVHRLSKEGQEDPKMQIRAAIGAIRGWISNLENGTSPPLRVAGGLKFQINHIESIVSRFPDLDWDSEPFTAAKE